MTTSFNLCHVLKLSPFLNFCCFILGPITHYFQWINTPFSFSTLSDLFHQLHLLHQHLVFEDKDPFFIIIFPIYFQNPPPFPIFFCICVIFLYPFFFQLFPCPVSPFPPCWTILHLLIREQRLSFHVFMSFKIFHLCFIILSLQVFYFLN